MLPLLVRLATDAPDPVPAPNDVKAGWVALFLFVALGVAVALLAWSLTRHLRKARDNAEAGVFDPSDPPRTPRNGIPHTSK